MSQSPESTRCALMLCMIALFHPIIQQLSKRIQIAMHCKQADIQARPELATFLHSKLRFKLK